MKIALVCCPIWVTLHPPLSIATLQAFLKRSKYEVMPFDFNIKFYNAHKIKHGVFKALFWCYHKKLDRLFSILNLINRREYNDYIQEILSSNADIVCFTTYKQNGLTSEFFAKKIKDAAPQKKIVFGGPFVSDEDKRMCLVQSKVTDAIIVGEGESALLKVLKSINREEWEDKCQIREVAESGFIDLNKEPIPDFDGLPFGDYEIKSIPYSPSRGCPQKCTYCFESAFWKSYRQKSGKKMFDDLKKLRKVYKLKSIGFATSAINGNMKELEKMCDLIIKSRLDVVWGGQALCRDLDAKFLKKMKRAGCFFLGYGVESGSQRILNLMKKGYDIKEMGYIIRMTDAMGIKVWTNFIVGYPSETWSDFYETVKFLYRNHHAILIARANPAFPIKGTKLDNIIRKDYIFWHLNGINQLTRLIRWIILEALIKVLIRNGHKKLKEHYDAIAGTTTTNQVQ